MIAGVNGSGKTTSIGKLAKWLQSQGASVLLAAGDTFRAAAREQLVVWGERNGVPVIAQESGDPGAVVFDAAGRRARARHRRAHRRHRGAPADAAAPHGGDPQGEARGGQGARRRAARGVLVLDANTGQNSLAQVKAFDDALGLTGLILTKLDGTAKGGVVCAIAHARSKDPEADPAPLRRRRRRHRRPAPVRRERLRRGAGWLASRRSPSAIPGGQEALQERQLRHRRGRARVRHRTLGRRKVDAAQADRRDRATDLGLGDRERPERRRPQARRRALPQAQHRARVPGPEAAVRPQRVRQRDAAARLFRAAAAAKPRGARAPRWTRWGCSRARRRTRSSSRAASSNASPSRARSSTGPAILIGDEPTANLDAESAARVSTCSSRFNQVGVTVLIATHDQAPRSGATAARVLRLEEGRIA